MQQDFQKPREQDESFNQEKEPIAVLPERFDTPLSGYLGKVVEPSALMDAMTRLQQSSDQETLYDGLTAPSIEERRAFMVAPVYLEDAREETLSALAYSIVNEHDKATELVGGISLLLLSREATEATADRNISYAVATADLSERSEVTRLALANFLKAHGGQSDEVRDFFIRQLHDADAGKVERAVSLQALTEWKGDTEAIYQDALRRIEESSTLRADDLDLFAAHADPEKPHQFSEEAIVRIVSMVQEASKESERYSAFRALSNSEGNEAFISRTMYDLLNVEQQTLGVVIFATNIVALHADQLEDPEAFIAPFVDRFAENDAVVHSLFGETLTKITATAFFRGRPVRDDIIDVLPSVYQLAKSSAPEMQGAALRIFAFVGEEASDAIPEIGALLNSEDEQVRRLAGVAALKLGQSVEMLRPVLLDGIKGHEDEYSRALFALSLAGLDFNLDNDINVRTDVSHYEDRHFETIDRLKDLYTQLESEPVKQGVLLTLGRIVEDSEEVSETCSKELQTSSRVLQEAALTTVMMFEKLDRRLLEAVRQFSLRESGDLAEQAKKIYDYFNQNNNEGDGFE